MKGPITGHGYAQVAGVTAAARCLKPSVAAGGTAFETSDRNIVNVRKYLVVTPEAPQNLMWVVPGNEISYLVESNTDWNVT